MRIAIDSDEAATELKHEIVTFLKSLEMDIEDLNYKDEDNNYYPVIGYNLAQHIKNKKYDRGILLCGTGIGMAIIANKVQGVYAAVCHDTFSAERLVKSNDAQIITLGARVVGIELAKRIVLTWLDSSGLGDRSIKKVIQLKDLEQKSFSLEKKEYINEENYK